MNHHVHQTNTPKAKVHLATPLSVGEDIKNLRKKYQQTMEALRIERKDKQMLQIECRENRDIIEQQSKQLKKKDDLIDILMEQIKYLKTQLQESKNSSQYGDVKTTKPSYLDDSPHNLQEGKDVVGGYFASIFK